MIEGNLPANFNGQKPAIDPADAVMLLIDHQSGLFQTVKDMPMTELRADAATVATLAKIPVITTASVPQGPNGPLIPEIHEHAPHARAQEIALARTRCSTQRR